MGGLINACMGHEGRVSGMGVVGLENRNMGKVVWDHAWLNGLSLPGFFIFQRLAANSLLST